MAADEKMDSQALATSLIGSVSETFAAVSSEKFSQDPTVATRPITLIKKGVMKVSSFSSIHVGAYISYIYYYMSEADKGRNKPCGVIVLYVKESGVLKLLPTLGHGNQDYFDQVLVKNMVGELCNNIVDGLKNVISSFGYKDLQISEPNNYKNIIEEGVIVPKKQTECQEISIYFWDSRPVIIDVVLDV